MTRKCFLSFATTCKCVISNFPLSHPGHETFAAFVIYLSLLVPLAKTPAYSNLKIFKAIK